MSTRPCFVVDRVSHVDLSELATGRLDPVATRKPVSRLVLWRRTDAWTLRGIVDDAGNRNQMSVLSWSGIAGSSEIMVIA
jgi:hypothetical protein